MYRFMYTEGPVVTRGSQVSYMHDATTQAVSPQATPELIVPEEGKIKLKRKITWCTYFDGPPCIAPKSAQLDLLEKENQRAELTVQGIPILLQA